MQQEFYALAAFFMFYTHRTFCLSLFLIVVTVLLNIFTQEVERTNLCPWLISSYRSQL